MQVLPSIRSGNPLLARNKGCSAGGRRESFASIFEGKYGQHVRRDRGQSTVRLEITHGLQSSFIHGNQRHHKEPAFIIEASQDYRFMGWAFFLRLPRSFLLNLKAQLDQKLVKNVGNIHPALVKLASKITFPKSPKCRKVEALGLQNLQRHRGKFSATVVLVRIARIDEKSPNKNMGVILILKEIYPTRELTW